MAKDRNRPRKQLTFAPDVHAYIQQPHINASRLVEHALRTTIEQERIMQAALEAGMTEEEVKEARRQ